MFYHDTALEILNKFFFEACIFGKNFKYCASVL